MAKISKIVAREVLDSNGTPTIEGKLFLDSGETVWAQASSGASIGKFEALELRDGDTRYDGKGVNKSISYINNLIGPKLVGADVSRYAEIDQWLIKADGTPNKVKLGSNTLMVVSQLVWKAAASVVKQPFYSFINHYFNDSLHQVVPLDKIPSPIINIINGGKHGTTNIEFQEFHIVPSTSMKFSAALELGSQVYKTIQKVLTYRNAGISVSDEGGFAPNLLTNTDALEVIKEAVNQDKLNLGEDIFMGLDCAATSYFKDGKYLIKDRQQALSTTEYIDFLSELTRNYSVLVLEDPLEEEDMSGWKMITQKMGTSVYIVGDDLTAGNRDRVDEAIKNAACNACVLKFNQVATIVELLELAAILKSKSLKTVFSHRLGESTDSIIADIAVGMAADFVKFGSPVRGERVVKYNRLLEIEEELKL